MTASSSSTCENCGKVRLTCEPFTCPITGDEMTLVCTGCRFHLETGKTWQEDLNERVAATKALVDAIAAKPQAYVFPDVDGRSIHIVAKDPEFPAQWRHTRWDSIGAAGHLTRAAFADAVILAKEMGANLAKAVPVDPSTIESVVAAMGLVPGVELPRNNGEHEAAMVMIDTIVVRAAAKTAATSLR